MSGCPVSVGWFSGSLVQSSPGFRLLLRGGCNSKGMKDGDEMNNPLTERRKGKGVVAVQGCTADEGRSNEWLLRSYLSSAYVMKFFVGAKHVVVFEVVDVGGVYRPL